MKLKNEVLRWKLTDNKEETILIFLSLLTSRDAFGVPNSSNSSKSIKYI